MIRTLFKSDLQMENKPKRDKNGRLMAGHHQGRPKGSLSSASMLRDRPEGGLNR